MAEEYKVHVHSTHYTDSDHAKAKRKLADELRSALSEHTNEFIGVRADMRSDRTHWWTIILPNQYIHGRIETEEPNEHFA